MKKHLFLLLIVTVMPVYTQENIVINMNFGNLSAVGYFPSGDGYSPELSLTLINVGIEHQQTRIGLEFSPFKTYFWPRIYESEDTYSFLNMNLYWNIINSDFSGSSFYFGPFASINYLFFNEVFYPDRLMFTAGAQMGFRIGFGGFNYNIFSLEAGYRLIDEKGKFFVGGKIDIVALILFVLIIRTDS